MFSNNNDLIIMIVLLTTICITLIIILIFWKSTRIKRSVYENIKDDFLIANNELNSKIALEKDLRQNIQHLQSKLDIERDTNNSQSKELSQFRANLHSTQNYLEQQQALNRKQNEEIKDLNQQISNIKSELSSTEIVKTNLEEKINKQHDDFEEIRKKSLIEFENIANRLFDEKSSTFSRQSKENIAQILNPLKENIQEFKKKVEETYDKESKERFTLESKIKELVSLNQQISEDATNLTNALKGQSKTQGNWGEMILENILEYSGLIKNQQFFIQQSFKDKQGKRKQPDVVIKYPDNRYVIIDSKVSLVAYEKFVNSDDTDIQKGYLKEHIQSIKNHIDNLSAKEYESFNKSLDFVFLFIPIEPAFLTALQQDNQLWNYAYSKRIVLMSPTNLIATLRVIADVWSKEIQNQNAREISKRGEKLYDKFVGFVDDLLEIEKHLSKTNEKFDDAINKLSKGRGNLIGQAENLKKLGVTSKKQLPDRFIQNNIELDNNE